MTSLLMPPEQQFIDANGNPYAGGKIYTYVSNSLTPKNTWQNITKTISNANPIILNSAGRCIMFGDGSYRIILKDSLNNTIFDQETDAYLLDTSISSVMLPVTEAATLQTARDLMGVTQAIQNGINTVNLLSGPTGPTGPQGAQGAVGPAGSTSSYIPQLVGSNPGYTRFPNINNTASNLFVQFGEASTDGSGNASVSFSTPFPNALLSIVASNTDGGTGSWWIGIASKNNSGFTAKSSSPLHGGGWQGGPIGFCWIAIGY